MRRSPNGKAVYSLSAKGKERLRYFKDVKFRDLPPNTQDVKIKKKRKIGGDNLKLRK